MSDILAYHQATKHSPDSVAAGAHALDWSIRPLPFKIYRALEAVEPPPAIGRLCRLSNGVLRWRRYGGETYGFRAAACTGALYHVELYLATADRQDLPAGLYHYGAHDGRLRRLRGGDVRAALYRATGRYDPIGQSPLVFITSSTFWRNAWKYRARAYRHVWWDGGAVVANLLALLAADGQPASVVMGFADDEVNQLVGLDGRREAATSIVAVGEGAPDPPPVGELPSISPETEPLSPREVRHPEIEEAHRATTLAGADEAAAWRGRGGGSKHRLPRPVTEGDIDDVIGRRRSARRFGPRPLGRTELEKLLAAALLPIPGDAFSPLPVEPFLIVNAVNGLPAGVYDRRLSTVREGSFRRAAADLALWQELAAQAAANVYFLAHLEGLIERRGERAYRVAQLAGGICGERLELAAAGLGLGATGLTFFDDAVRQFVGPAAAGREVMYLAALGSR